MEPDPNVIAGVVNAFLDKAQFLCGDEAIAT
jgi:hypothetical protein